MTEDYLHYIWKYKLLNSFELKTTDGEILEILDWGFHNKNSGPDFSHGKVKIGGTTWVGNIEIHINSSDWLKHNHQADKAYDTVILHVVYNYDKEIKTTEGSVIPTLELRDLIDYSKYEDYERFIFKPIPCIDLLPAVNDVIVSSALNQMLVERLESKTNLIIKELEKVNYNWEQVLFQEISKSMGLKVNSIPMLELSSRIPFSIIKKLGDNQLAIESILFGLAGFLNDEQNGDYIKELKKEFTFHKAKHNFIPMNKQEWKFSKMRPVNFPTLRIAQLAKLLASKDSFVELFVSKQATVKELQQRLEIEINEGFWHSHYTFKTESKPMNKSIGGTLMNSIIINTISPFLYCYGNYKDEFIYKEKAIELIENSKPENNRITRLYKDAVTINSAFDSQALIQCHNNYCVPKKCLECGIGINLLK